MSLNADALINSIKVPLSTDYINAEGDFPDIFSPIIISGNSRIATEKAVEELDMILTENFYACVSKFNEDFVELEDLNLGLGLINEFEKEINESTKLSTYEKVFLLNYASSHTGFINMMQQDAIERVWNQVSSELNIDTSNSAARIAGCSVEWRGVWLEAVGGLALGAIRGAVVGGTTGTFTVPGLGTATGAIGGAVFGGAAGFAGGAASAIVYNLLGSCTRSTSSTSARCSNTMRMYQMGFINTPPPLCHSLNQSSLLGKRTLTPYRSYNKPLIRDYSHRFYRPVFRR